MMDFLAPEQNTLMSWFHPQCVREVGFPHIVVAPMSPGETIEAYNLSNTQRSRVPLTVEQSGNPVAHICRCWPKLMLGSPFGWLIYIYIYLFSMFGILIKLAGFLFQVGHSCKSWPMGSINSMKWHVSMKFEVCWKISVFQPILKIVFNWNDDSPLKLLLNIVEPQFRR